MHKNILNVWNTHLSIFSDLVNDEISLGRSIECDIVIYKSILPGPVDLLSISKKHFVISKDPQDEYIIYITDCSKNGTYVNHKLIGKGKKIVLQNNDIISLGETLQGKILNLFSAIYYMLLKEVESNYNLYVLVYIFKSMTFSVVENYLPHDLRLKYTPTRLLGKGACGEVRLAYEKVSAIFSLLLDFV